ncbi:hypothetical protein Ancab_022994, partial [Ancistrocladus abbreviatus]
GPSRWNFIRDFPDFISLLRQKTARLVTWGHGARVNGSGSLGGEGNCLAGKKNGWMTY